MAFQMSTLYPRIRALTSTGLLSRGRADCQSVGVKFKNILSYPSPQLKRPLHSVVRQGKNLPATCKKASPLPRDIDIANRVKKFSTTTATLSQSIQRDGSISRGKTGLLCRVALGALGVTVTAVVSVHTSARVTMAAGPDDKNINLDSAEGDWKETKDFLLSLSVKDRRQYYRSRSYVALEDVPVWRPTAPDASEKPHYSRNDKLDQKISVYSGDITQLEIGAIVNAANKTLLGGGGVDGAIHRTAGPKLKKECSSLHGCETGQAKITCGYGLPAQYVIHTVGPVAVGGVGEEERSRLRDCYRNSLAAATTPQNQVRSVAFPCISTGVYGYPPEQAVHEALATVREYLDEHHDKLDRVIFCVFLPTDRELYEKNLPLYFPGALKSKL